MIMGVIVTAILVWVAKSNSIDPMLYQYIWLVVLLGMLAGIFSKGTDLGLCIKIAAIGVIPFVVYALTRAYSSFEVVVFTTILVCWYSTLAYDCIKIGRWLNRVLG